MYMLLGMPRSVLVLLLLLRSSLLRLVLLLLVLSVVAGIALASLEGIMNKLVCLSFVCACDVCRGRGKE